MSSLDYNWFIYKAEDRQWKPNYNKVCQEVELLTSNGFQTIIWQGNLMSWKHSHLLLQPHPVNRYKKQQNVTGKDVSNNTNKQKI